MDVDVVADGLAPSEEEDVSWLRRYSEQEQVEEGEYDVVDDEEKACIELDQGVRRFNKVFGVDSKGYVCVPSNCSPGKGSPSFHLKQNRKCLSQSFYSTHRIRMNFKAADGHLRKFFGTCFAVSPTLALTARHCVEKEKMDLVQVCGCQGALVYEESLDGDERWEGLVVCKGLSKSKVSDQQGLFTKGTDVCCIKTENSFDEFLLPCSPDYNACKKNIATLSYPGINNFLKDCQSELSSSATNVASMSAAAAVSMSGADGASMSAAGAADGHICKLYKTVLDVEIEDEVRIVAALQNESPESIKKKDYLMSSIRSKAKEVLLMNLNAVFNKFTSGALVCSVGYVICDNGIALGANTSTLRGSSGAALCALELFGHFIGVHSAGSIPFDMNIATSSDNVDFVKMYCKDVLPSLPTFGDVYWKSRKMDGFLNWLNKHKQHVPHDSSWYRSLFLKRQLDDEADESTLSSISSSADPCSPPSIMGP